MKEKPISVVSISERSTGRPLASISVRSAVRHWEAEKLGSGTGWAAEAATSEELTLSGLSTNNPAHIVYANSIISCLLMCIRAHVPGDC